MNLFLSVLNLILVLIGLVSVLLVCAGRVHESKEPMHYLILLHDDDAEWVLRTAMTQYCRTGHNRSGFIYAVDMGLSHEAATVCERMTMDYAPLIFCKPEQLPDLLNL